MNLHECSLILGKSLKTIRTMNSFSHMKKVLSLSLLVFGMHRAQLHTPLHQGIARNFSTSVTPEATNQTFAPFQ